MVADDVTILTGRKKEAIGMENDQNYHTYAQKETNGKRTESYQAMLHRKFYDFGNGTKMFNHSGHPFQCH